jgi:copper homeostasis protein
MNRLLVEICVPDVESALAAERGGADRIELCENLAVGGVTPSAGAIAVVCRRLEIPVHVLIRPRGGNFVYTEAEFESMRRDIDVAKALGAAGIVSGGLNRDLTVDEGRMAILIEDARPLSVTFHKAFDEVRDAGEALEMLVVLGVDRILTSGRRPRAVEALVELRALHEDCYNRLCIMPGGGIAERDLPAILGAGFRELHLGSSVMTQGRTDSEKVRSLVAAARLELRL